MKLRRSLRFYNLKRPKIRQSWNKYNLYNMTRIRLPRLLDRTFFQQKWAAKAMMRAYHGEHIKESKWERMFDRRMESVVNMDPRYMAAHDGSEQAEGRGSGKQQPPGQPRTNTGDFELGAEAPATNLASEAVTPYMQMAFAPMERRLDIAIFRSLFASSARQARQFVVHGAVTVNGRKMIYPGYLLNPGDMFQVDVDKVLYATGTPNGKANPRHEEKRLSQGKRRSRKKGGDAKKAVSDEASDASPQVAPESAESAASDETLSAASEEGVEALSKASEDQAEAAIKKHRAGIKALRAKAKAILAEPEELGTKRKQAIRQFVKDAQTAMSRAGKSSPEESSQKVDELSAILADLSVSPSAKSDSQGAGVEVDPDNLTPAERERFEELLRDEAENPYDPSKPYMTPWKPRPYMSPFAFIPRYLEVNQNICAAVYLRHPVARPGFAEVPTPFPPEIGQLAHNWYLRRR